MTAEPPPAVAPGRIVGIAAAFYAAAAVAAVVIAGLAGNGPTLLGERAPDAGGLALGAGVAAGVVVLCKIADARVEAARRAGTALAEILGPLSWPSILFLALSSGAAEEVLFRGALQPVLGLWITSALFGAAHVVRKPGLAFYPVFAAATGLALGWLRIETGSVAPPALAHAVVNGVNLTWLQRRLKA